MAIVRPACPLCALPQHLERPRIDDEAALVWLPEMSQQAINALMREIHIQIRALGEDLQAERILGLRLMPLGRFFDGERDVHPEIVDAWRKPAENATPSTRSIEQRSALG